MPAADRSAVPEGPDLPRVSIVVATRNRLSALAESLPLMLAQTVNPHEIFVVDSSDDPEPVRALVATLAKTTDIPIEHIPSAPGLTIQRNVGLARVTCPVVAYPDDDSLMFKTYIEEIARVYAADTDERLAGVTVLPSRVDPRKAPGMQAPEAKQSVGPKPARRPSALTAAKASLHTIISRTLAPPPYAYLRREIASKARSQIPASVASLGCVVVPNQEGFRMSFRTSHLRKAPFNENLSGYALGEDIDVCYGLAPYGIFVRINKALIFHNEFPGPRVNGARWGLMQPVNIAYIVSRHTQPGHAARKAVAPWLRYLILEAGVRIGSKYQRDRIKGLLTARRLVGRLTNGPREQADEIYRTIMSEL